MTSEYTLLWHVLAMVAAVTLGLGAIVWQIFRSEKPIKKNAGR
jgi:disulfide bond formation protein DsbB